MTSALCAAFVAAGLLSNPVLAQTRPVAAPGQNLARCLPGIYNAARPMRGTDCYTMEEFNKGMRAEGLRTYIIGDRTTQHDDRSALGGVRIDRYLNTVAMNPNGKGIQAEGNRPRAETSTEMRIRAQLRNVRLYDARRSGTPHAAYLGGSFNGVVNELAGRGTFPMAVADTLHQDSQNGERTGLPIVVFGNMQSRTVSIQTLLPNGNASTLVGMVNAEYTPFALELLDAAAPQPPSAALMAPQLALNAAR